MFVFYMHSCTTMTYASGTSWVYAMRKEELVTLLIENDVSHSPTQTMGEVRKLAIDYL